MTRYLTRKLIGITKFLAIYMTVGAIGIGLMHLAMAVFNPAQLVFISLCFFATLALADVALR